MRRRRFVTAGLALPAGLLVPAALLPRTALALTPECRGRAERTPRQTEGPFYTPNTPRRDSLIEPGAKGERIVVAGFVHLPDCRPVGAALIDVWHADENGAYDNSGFRYRGHVFTDERGSYRFETIVPALYPGRARHIHVKVGMPGRTPLTTQLYFPGDAGNARDRLHQPELDMRRAPGGWRFDFVIAA